MSSWLLMLFIIFFVAKYGSVVGGLFSAIVPEGLKGKSPSVRGDSMLVGHCTSATVCLNGLGWTHDAFDVAMAMTIIFANLICGHY